MKSSALKIIAVLVFLIGIASFVAYRAGVFDKPVEQVDETKDSGLIIPSSKSGKIMHKEKVVRRDTTISIEGFYFDEFAPSSKNAPILYESDLKKK